MKPSQFEPSVVFLYQDIVFKITQIHDLLVGRKALIESTVLSTHYIPSSFNFLNYIDWRCRRFSRFSFLYRLLRLKIKKGADSDIRSTVASICVDRASQTIQVLAVNYCCRFPNLRSLHGSWLCLKYSTTIWIQLSPMLRSLS